VKYLVDPPETPVGMLAAEVREERLGRSRLAPAA